MIMAYKITYFTKFAMKIISTIYSCQFVFVVFHSFFTIFFTYVGTYSY